MLNAQDNELLTRTGAGTPMGELFRRFWMPALLSSEVAERDGPPVRVRLLGEDFVAFRDSEGQVGVVDPRCPHRGANLYWGRNEEGGLRCAYHGWKFDTRGRCVDLPTLEPGEATERIRRKMHVKALAVQEAGGIVWAYLGPGEAPPLPDLEFVTVPGEHRFVSKKLQECNWAQACEGGLDTAHFSYLHMSLGDEGGETSAMGQSALVASAGTNPSLIRWVREDGRPRFSVLDHEAGIVIGGARTADDGNLYWRISQFLLPNHGLTPAAFPGENYHGQTWVPIDDHSCWIYCWTWNPVRPLTEAERAKFRGSHAVHAATDANHVPLRNRANEYLIDRDEQKHRSYTGIRGVSEQDACIQDSQGFIADRTREHLGPTDIGVVRFRRCILGSARDLAAGLEPVAARNPRAFQVRSGSAIAPASHKLEQVMLDRFGHVHGRVTQEQKETA